MTVVAGKLDALVTDLRYLREHARKILLALYSQRVQLEPDRNLFARFCGNDGRESEGYSRADCACGKMVFQGFDAFRARRIRRQATDEVVIHVIGV